ncbi:hypothetical protein AVW14_19305 [Stenotrophomonas maltophilia]|nr:hypothetical protein AVW14_19305 [Stenotrophomonas maltophilia]PZS71055.1 hypothetical protein A7X76_09815 [Stenotrophomonas maltophilia]
MQQLVELGDGGAALAAQHVGLVQNRRDAALFCNRRELNWDLLQLRCLDGWVGVVLYQSRRRVVLKPAKQVRRIDIRGWQDGRKMADYVAFAAQSIDPTKLRGHTAFCENDGVLWEFLQTKLDGLIRRHKFQ